MHSVHSSTHAQGRAQLGECLGKSLFGGRAPPLKLLGAAVDVFFEFVPDFLSPARGQSGGGAAQVRLQGGGGAVTAVMALSSRRDGARPR